MSGDVPATRGDIVQLHGRLEALINGRLAIIHDEIVRLSGRVEDLVALTEATRNQVSGLENGMAHQLELLASIRNRQGPPSVYESYLTTPTQGPPSLAGMANLSSFVAAMPAGAGHPPSLFGFNPAPAGDFDDDDPYVTMSQTSHVTGAGRRARSPPTHRGQRGEKPATAARHVWWGS
jgi:hypothetical protein